ncbi:SDR family oxidoreductase [Robertkochia solimangrovi]|uniref:SDR family oxidoreductase n=1 Tax=Robertkochia solimangrovi TaxID=2213046 RepID=UPI00117DC7BE|nr:SDR family oxidoreductase [Robertkochia solimangrovi]TRZ44321.1 D-mannonate oxidoreductase [Robertkochia solimangrovi]
MEKKLTGSTVVVTGGTGVLGSCFCRALADNGAKVAILGRSLDKAENLATGINNAGGHAIGISVDVCDKAGLENAKEVILNAFGAIDILINGAGGNHPEGVTADEYFDSEKRNSGVKDFFELGLEGMDHVFRLNYMGTFLPVQVFAAEMIGRRGCSIINISSVSAFLPLTKVPAYSGAKAAISNLTQWLSVYFAKEGIRVNAIMPGFFLTDQNRSLLTEPDGSLTARGHKIIGQTPMGRFGDPEDLISTLLWLCDPASAFVTGTVIPVDGGFTAFNGV